MPVVNDTLVRPDLTPITQARVEIRLFLNGADGVAYVASSEVFSKVTLHPDPAGLISVTLPANNTWTPSGSYYQVAFYIPGEDVRYETFIVPSGAGPYTIGSILSVTPTAGIPFLSDALPLALAATALAGTDSKTSRDDHVHPWTNLATDAELATHAATPHGGSLSSATPLALAASAVIGTDAGGSHGDHVHPTTGVALAAHTHSGVYDPAGTAASAVSTHAGLADPHPGYLTPAEGNAAYEALGAVATHAALTTSIHGIADTADLARKANANTWALAQTFSAQSIHTLGLQLGADVFLVRDAANVLAQRNGTTAQSLRVHNTFTDASNYERGALTWLTNRLTLETEQAGTGTSRSLDVIGADVSLISGSISFGVGTNGRRWNVDGSGHLKAGGANQNVWNGISALATTATSGFLGVNSCAGPPTGVPASIPTGQIPLVFDSTNLKLYAYTGGAWKASAAFS